MTDTGDLFIDRDPIAYAKHFLDLKARHEGIAGSNTTIRRLIAEAERLRAEVERLQAAADTAMAIRQNLLAEMSRIHFDRNRYCDACGGGWPCVTLRAITDFVQTIPTASPSPTEGP